ncbi:hypothetical protein C2S52_012839 [Perilla frutescens var. hirtella]|nr:hypothetical protein C2S52_012839 [Perilla frutescens var. hirtella]
MGSCLSTNTAAQPSKPPRISTSTKHNDGGSKSPPPVYEETVKEVLSETPAIPKKRSPSPPIPRIFHGSERMLHQNGGAVKKPSDVGSEIHITHSESDSNSTENDGAFHWPRFNYRGPFPAEVKRENMAGRSPARRSNKSPGRVNPGSGHGRKTGGGESSERRSRSPVIHSDSGSSKTGLSTSRSLRKTGNSPGRVGYGSGEKIRKGEEVRESEEMTRPPTSNDLLENSLVSLECFIFL